MKETNTRTTNRIMVSAVCALLMGQVQADAGVSDVVKSSGITGGIIVHLDCNDAKETAKLRIDSSLTVQGLDTNPKDIAAARKYLASQGLYGKITANLFDGKKLPYADDLVNMIVSEGATQVPESEILRVLRPLGTAYISGKKIVKPWPKEIDEWGHFLHGPDNNAVAKDTRVGMPRVLQWVGGQSWARSHEEFATVSIAVSARGKIFYIIDQAPQAYISFNSEWKLVARDAFNGHFLWERPIPKWNNQMRHFRSGPAHLPRRLIAVDDKVYVTLGLDAPLSELDANTGKTIKTYPDSEWTEEILAHEGTLYVLMGSSEVNRFGAGLREEGEPDRRNERFLAAFDAKSGKELWRRNAKGKDFVLPQGVAISGGKLFVHDIKGLACLDPKTGTPLWFKARPTLQGRYGFSTSTLVATPEVVLLTDYVIPTNAKQSKVVAETDILWGVAGWSAGNSPDSSVYISRLGKSEVTAYSTADGKELWKAPCGEGYNSPTDLFVVDGLVWLGPYNRKQTSKDGYDLLTGEVKKTIDITGTPMGMPHDRCYRNKASVNYVFGCRDGIEVMDYEKGWIRNNSWTRGVCQFGILPCNGLIYAPPDSCACHLKMRMPGFKAYSSQRVSSVGKPITAENRLTKGPAFGKLAQLATIQTGTQDWPMYRNDIIRSGATSSKVAVTGKAKWTASIGGKLTQPVMANGRVYVAASDRCTVYALNSADGTALWSYSAGAKIDSSPTLYKGMVLFGSADGYVHCLDAATGSLAWTFLAAPEERVISVHGRLESSWPVHGSLIVKNDELCFTAGSSSYLGGGIYFYRLNPVTGEMLASNVVTDIDPVTEKQIDETERYFDSSGVVTDILTSDGQSIFLKHLQLDDQGNKSDGAAPHLFSPTSLLEEDWYVRTYWTYAPGIKNAKGYAGYNGWPGTAKENPAGRILSITDDTVYGYGRISPKSGSVGHKSNRYHLFASPKAYEVEAAKPLVVPPGLSKAEAKKFIKKHKKPAIAKTFEWSETAPFTVRAMVATADSLLIAGVPDMGKRVGDIDPMLSPEKYKESQDAQQNKKGYDPTKAPLGFENPAEAVAAFRGERGAYLRLVSKEDGSMTKEFKLDGVPVSDGMSVANGNLFISLKNGSVSCY